MCQVMKVNGNGNMWRLKAKVNKIAVACGLYCALITT